MFRRDDVKILRDNKAFMINLMFPLAVIGIIFIVMWPIFLWEKNIEEIIKTWVIFLCPMIFIILIAQLFSAKSYSSQLIMYGNKKVTVKRCSIKCIHDGIPIGEREERIDEFFLDELEAYGLSHQYLEHRVEFNYHPGVKGCTELFFQLKSGKKIGYDIMYCNNREIEDFFNYIYDETGIKVLRKEETEKEIKLKKRLVIFAIILIILENIVLIGEMIAEK